MSKRHSKLYFDSTIPSTDLSVWAGNRDLSETNNMSDRYRYSGRRTSPPLYNPARASLPINLAYPEQQPHLHVVPSSRRETPAPRSSNSSVSGAGTVTTTYKVTADPPSHGSHLRSGSHSRRSTIDSHNRPTIVTTTRTPHRPVVHSGGGRPASPMKNPYRSSEEDYVITPATSSRHGHHKRHYSVTMDNADMNRLRDRDESRLRIMPAREPNYRSTTRTRPVYSGQVVRHADSIADDYGDDGYGYTNPQDLVRYDLDRSNAPLRSRRDSFEGGRPRPTSITGYNDLQRPSYETRERGPPPSTRGFDKIRTPYDHASLRMPRPASPGNSMAPMESVARPPPFEPIEPIRRSNSSSGHRARPTSYHADKPRGPSQDYYEVQDDRRYRQDYDDRVESRGFGVRTERPPSRNAVKNERSVDRPIDRPESRTANKQDRSESRSAVKPERLERSERERSDRPEKADDKKEHKGRDALATGLSLAGAALGINAVKNAHDRKEDKKEDRKDSDSDEREDRRRRREYEEESSKRRDRDEEDLRRRNKDRDDAESKRRDDRVRDDAESKRRDERVRDDSSRDAPLIRDSPPPRESRESREKAPRDKDVKDRSSTESPPINISGRNPRERQPSQDERDDKVRERRRRPENAIDSDSASDEKPRRENRPRGNSTAAAAAGGLAGAAVAAIPAFNPKDTMDLKALKEALNQKDSKPAVKESKETARPPRQSVTRDSAEASRVREDLNSDRRGRDPLAPAENRQLRVVSPPREKAEDKPVKGILRQPKEKFPEDPTAIREGVAPLKDAKRDGIPPDARWTKISRKMVNPEALEAGKERYEARDDFVIVLRVLSKEEVQGYAEVTQKIRAAREELEEIEATERRRARRERHERHKRERSTDPREQTERRRHRDRGHDHRRESDSESDTTDDDFRYGDRVSEKPKMLEPAKKRATFEDAMMTGGLGNSDIAVGPSMGNLKETKPGVYSGYVRNPPTPK